MPRITTSAISSRAAIKGEGAIHTEKWHRCWVKVQGQGHDSSAAAAICTSSLGYEESVNPEHQARKPAKKYNPYHDEAGRFTSGGGSGEGKALGGSDPYTRAYAKAMATQPLPGGWKTLEGKPGSSVGAVPTTLEARPGKIPAVVPTNLPFKYAEHTPSGGPFYNKEGNFTRPGAGAMPGMKAVAPATVLQVPARAKAQAQAKAMMEGYLRNPPVRAAAVAEIKAALGAGDKTTEQGVRNYAKALRAQLAPKPIQAARHAKSHVHGKSKT